MTGEHHRSRLQKLQHLAREARVDVLLLSRLPDIRWASGFTGSNALLAVGKGSAVLATDDRYREQAAMEVEGARIVLPGYDLIGGLAEDGVLSPSARVGIQSEHATLQFLDDVQEQVPEGGCVPIPDLTRALRAIKEAFELDRIRGAQDVVEQAFERAMSVVQPVLTERQLAAELQYRMLLGGAERMAFDPIVATGAHAALPHAQPRDVPLGTDTLVLVDVGCMVDGYASDMTRMIAIGTPDPAAMAAVEAVTRALRTATETIRPGVEVAEPDALARRSIEESGIEHAYTHSLGHGVGLEVHEAPRVSRRSTERFEAGQVVTVEPGVYNPGRFGVRIEDLVVVRSEGSEVLTSLPHAPVRIGS